MNTDSQFNPAYTAAVQQWLQMRADLKKLTADEMALRKQIMAFAIPKPVFGTNSAVIPGNKELQVIFSQEVKAVKDEKDPRYSGLLEAMKKINPHVAAELLRWTPTVSKSSFDALTAEEKLVLAPYVEEKNKTPTIEIKELNAE